MSIERAFHGVHQMYENLSKKEQKEVFVFAEKLRNFLKEESANTPPLIIHLATAIHGFIVAKDIEALLDEGTKMTKEGSIITDQVGHS